MALRADSENEIGDETHPHTSAGKPGTSSSTTTSRSWAKRPSPRDLHPPPVCRVNVTSTIPAGWVGYAAARQGCVSDICGDVSQQQSHRLSAHQGGRCHTSHSRNTSATRSASTDLASRLPGLPLSRAAVAAALANSTHVTPFRPQHHCWQQRRRRRRRRQQQQSCRTVDQ